jgi:hypothetical protein
MPNLDRHIPELRLAEDREFSHLVRNLGKQTNCIKTTLDENLKRKTMFG